MDTVKTGTYLATLRKSANMTQQEVADRLGAWYAFQNILWYILGATAVALIVVAVVQFNKRLKK